MARLIATFSYRYDADLVDDLLKNISFVDDYVCVDDTQRTNLWCHEGQRKATLRRLARQKGADWILHCSPDERYEDAAGNVFREIVEGPLTTTVYGADLREMYTVDAYRTDGIWGTKKQYRLIPLHPDFDWGFAAIQQSMRPSNAELVKLDLNLYHFKHLTEEAAKVRAAVFRALDPDNEQQFVGYDYLTDTKDMTLEQIPEGRGYSPPFDPDYRYKFPKVFMELVK